jgi:hypothetical protein
MRHFLVLIIPIGISWPKKGSSGAGYEETQHPLPYESQLITCDYNIGLNGK